MRSLSCFRATQYDMQSCSWFQHVSAFDRAAVALAACSVLAFVPVALTICRRIFLRRPRYNSPQFNESDVVVGRAVPPANGAAGAKQTA